MLAWHPMTHAQAWKSTLGSPPPNSLRVFNFFLHSWVDDPMSGPQLCCPYALDLQTSSFRPAVCVQNPKAERFPEDAGIPASVGSRPDPLGCFRGIIVRGIGLCGTGSERGVRAPPGCADGRPCAGRQSLRRAGVRGAAHRRCWKVKKTQICELPVLAQV